MSPQNRGPGRPAIGKGERVTIRLQPDLLVALDHFRSADPRGFTRPQAIRSLMKMLLGSHEADMQRRKLEIMSQHLAKRAAKGLDTAPR